MTTAPITRRILRLYDSASTLDVHAGREWYSVARDIAANLACASPYTFEQCAAVIAVLSAQARWADNVSAARACVQAHASGASVGAVPCHGGVTRANVVRAFAILDGTTFVGGPKTGAFHRAIIGDPDAVVLDRHAIRAGIPSYDGKRRVTVVERRALESAYRNAARLRGEAPRDMQAIVWIVRRGRAS